MRLLISVALAATTLLPLSLTAPIKPSSLPATSDDIPSAPEIERIVARAEAAEAAEAKKKKKKRPENAPMIMPPLPDDNTPYPPWLGQPGMPAYDFPGSRGSKGHWTMPAQPVDDPDEPGLVWFVDEKRDLSSSDGEEGESIDPLTVAKSEIPAAAEVEGRDASPSPQDIDMPLLGPGCIKMPLYGRWCPGDGPLPVAVGTGCVSEKVGRRDAAAIPPVSTDVDPTFETLPVPPAPLVLRRDDDWSPNSVSEPAPEHIDSRDTPSSPSPQPSASADLEEKMEHCGNWTYGMGKSKPIPARFCKSLLRPSEESFEEVGADYRYIERHGFRQKPPTNPSEETLRDHPLAGLRPDSCGYFTGTDDKQYEIPDEFCARMGHEDPEHSGCDWQPLYRLRCQGEHLLWRRSVSEEAEHRDAAAIPPVASKADQIFGTLPAQPAPLLLLRDDTPASAPSLTDVRASYSLCKARYELEVYNGKLLDNGKCLIRVPSPDGSGKIPFEAEEEDIVMYGPVRRDDISASISSSTDARTSHDSCRARWDFEVYDGTLQDNGKCLIRVPSPEGSGKISFEAEEEDIVSMYGYENAPQLKLRSASDHSSCKARHAGKVYEGTLLDNGKCEIWIPPPDGFGSMIPFDAEEKDIVRAYGPDGAPHQKLKNAAVYGFLDEKGHWHRHGAGAPNPGPVKPASEAAVQPRTAPDSSEVRRLHGHNPAAGTCFAMVNGERQKGHMKGNGNCAVVVEDAIGDWQITEIGDKDITGILDMDGNWHRHAKHATFPWHDMNGRWHIHLHPRLGEREVEPEDGWIDPADVPVLAPDEIDDDGIPIHF